jgi:PIN domain nuclease of toxin-antitoxin system
VRFLLDSHTLLWFLLDDPQLSSAARDAIADAENQILVSPASLWEIAIKISLGKYRLPQDYGEFMAQQLARNDFDLIPIELRHTAALIEMPFHHRDPFDRLLVAQAKMENITLISRDAALEAYDVQRLW